MSVTNTLSASNPAYWARRLQLVTKKTGVARQIASFEAQAMLTNGDTVHRPIPSDIYLDDYTAGTDMTEQSIGTTDDTLTVNISKGAAIYYDENEVKQNNIDVVNQFYIDRLGYQLRNEVDGRFMREITNAAITFDDGDNGGSAGNPINLTSSNVGDIFSDAWSKMRQNNVETDREWVAVVTPKVISAMKKSMILNGFNQADATLKNGGFDSGHRGEFLGWQVYESTNVCHSTVLSYSGQPSAGETVTIGSVVLTWAASAAAAGEVTIGADADASYTNLQNAIRRSGTGFVAVSAANKKLLDSYNAYATVNTTANTLTIYTGGLITVSEASANVTAGTTQALCYLARKGATDLVMQIEPTVQKNKAQLRNGYFYIANDLYGLKTFTEGTLRMEKLVLTA